MTDEPDPSLQFTLRMPAHPRLIATLRHVVRALEGWVDEETLERTELVASEIVTNAIRHGGSSSDHLVEVDIEATRVTVTMRVRDCGPAFTWRSDRTPQQGDVGGFGLHIANDVADTFTFKHIGTGNEVAFSVSAPPNDSA